MKGGNRMIYILCIPHKRSPYYIEILEVFLNKNIAYEKMKEFNNKRIHGFATIIQKQVTKEG